MSASRFDEGTRRQIVSLHDQHGVSAEGLAERYSCSRACIWEILGGFTASHGHRDLSPQQKRVFDFITSEHEARRGFPNFTAISQHMNWRSDATARDCVDMIATKGFIERYSTERGWAYRVKVLDAA